MTPDITVETHVQIGLDLQFVDISLCEDAVEREIADLASLPARVQKGETAAMLVGMSLDVASCIEADGSVTTLFITVHKSLDGNAETLISQIEKQFPIFGPELIYAWSKGYFHVNFSAWTAPEKSYRAALPGISNHERLEIRKAALEAVSKL